MNRFYESPDIVEKYIKYRPKYTKQVAERILNFYKNQQDDVIINLQSSFDLMVDVGCGSGQSTNIFQPYFKQIIGVDVSPQQVIQAKKQNKHKNIHFLEGSAEKIPVEDGSVDLVLAATAVHWFDLPKFYQEVKRILKPNTGCLAIIGYRSPSINLLFSPNDDLERKSYQIIKTFLDTCTTRTNQPIIQTAYRHSHTRYAAIFDAIPFCTKLRDDNLHLCYKASLAGLCHCMSSTDAYQEYMKGLLNKLNQEGQEITEDTLAKVDPLYHLLEDLLSLWNLESNQSDEMIFRMCFNPFILLAVCSHSNDSSIIQCKSKWMSVPKSFRESQ